MSKAEELRSGLWLGRKTATLSLIVQHANAAWEVASVQCESVATSGLQCISIFLRNYSQVYCFLKTNYVILSFPKVTQCIARRFAVIESNPISQNKKRPMRKLLIFAFMLPILSACASSASDPDTASSTEETGYITGSNLPVKKSKMSNVKVLPGEQAAAMREGGMVQSGPRN